MTAASSVDVVHLIPHPVAGLRFVAPLVQAQSEQGLRAELWIQEVPGLERFYAAIPCAKRLATFNLGLDPWQCLRGGLELWRAFRRLRPQCVAAHFSRGALIPLLAARLAGVPLRIYHNHGVPYLGYRGLMRVGLRMLERLNVALAHQTITVSAAMRDALVRDGVVPPSRCHVIGPGSACGLDLEEYAMCPNTGHKPAFKRERGFGKDDFVALFVGRAHRRKGFDLVLETWAAAFADRTGSHLLVAGGGDGDLRRVLGDRTPDNIHALGYVEDLRPCYAAADVVLLPSEHEGFGYALLEGAASACCLIASAIPGPDAIVSEGRNGFLVPVGDAGRLAVRLEQLRVDTGLRARLAAGARSAALGFDRRVVVDAYLAFMRPLLAKARRE